MLRRAHVASASHLTCSSAKEITPSISPRTSSRQVAKESRASGFKFIEFKSINVSTSESKGSDLITLLCAYDWGDGVPQQFDSGGDGGSIFEGSTKRYGELVTNYFDIKTKKLFKVIT
uniref:Uncharacterized protein n=1 Tax=Glossina austeni TaxID=7395 RepID=A0A1A9ULY9_GLOAU